MNHLPFLIYAFILLHEKFLQLDCLRAMVFQLNLKRCTCENYKTCAGSSINKLYHDLYVTFGINTTRDISKLSYNNVEISLVVFMPNIITNHAIIYTNYAHNHFSF